MTTQSTSYRVLVVHNDEHAAEELQISLASRFTCEIATTPDEVKVALSDASFDVVVSRDESNSSNGFDVLANVRQQSPRTRVILFGSETNRARVLADRRGVFDYLVWPGSEMLLFEAIDRALLCAPMLERLASATRSQLEELTEVLDALPVLVSFVAADERYALVNKAYEEWFGLSREDVVDRTLVEVIGDAAYARLAPFVRRGLAGERFDFEQHDVPYRHGGTRDVRVSFIPRHDTSGAVSGYVALLTDITTARRHTDERERLLRAEREAHVRTEFLLSVAAAIGAGLDPDGVTQRLVDTIVAARGNLASVWRRTLEGSLYRQVHAPFHPALVETRPGASEPIARVVATGKTLLIRDFEAWADVEAVALAPTGQSVCTVALLMPRSSSLRRDPARAHAPARTDGLRPRHGHRQGARERISTLTSSNR